MSRLLKLAGPDLRLFQRVSLQISLLFFLSALIFSAFSGGRSIGSIVWTQRLLGLGIMSGSFFSVGFWLVPSKSPVIVLMLCLLSIGWVSALNSRSEYNPLQRQFEPKAYVTYLPASVDGKTAAESMFRYTCLLGSFLTLVPLMSFAGRAQTVLATLFFTGAGVACIGILQRVGWINLYERNAVTNSINPFAAFNYHGNAGAFLNLVIPAGWILLQNNHANSPSSALRFRKSLMLVSLCIVVAAAFVNVSRASQVLTVAIIICLALQQIGLGPRLTISSLLTRSTARRAAVGIAGCIAVGLIGTTGAWQRWKSVGAQLKLESSRVILYRITFHMVTKGGPFGFGPGSFKLLLPLAPDLGPLYSHFIVTWHIPGQEVSIWSNVHNDYLQTLVEWGWAGAACWFLLVGMVVARAANSYFQSNPTEITPGDRAVAVGTLIALAAVAIHALVDYPIQVFPIQIYVVVYLAIAWSRHRINGT